MALILITSQMDKSDKTVIRTWSYLPLIKTVLSFLIKNDMCMLLTFVLIIDLTRMSVVSYIIKYNCYVNNENARGSSESINRSSTGSESR